jgi:hypothetical protein
LNGKPNARHNPLKMQLRPDVETIAIGGTGGFWWIWLIWWIRMKSPDTGGVSET